MKKITLVIVSVLLILSLSIGFCACKKELPQPLSDSKSFIAAYSNTSEATFYTKVITILDGNNAVYTEKTVFTADGVNSKIEVKRVELGELTEGDVTTSYTEYYTADKRYYQADGVWKTQSGSFSKGKSLNLDESYFATTLIDVNRDFAYEPSDMASDGLAVLHCMAKAGTEATILNGISVDNLAIEFVAVYSRLMGFAVSYTSNKLTTNVVTAFSYGQQAAVTLPQLG